MGTRQWKAARISAWGNQSRGGCRRWGAGGRGPGACVPVDEVEFHAPRHGERGEQRRDRERGARAHPSSRLCRAGVINHPRAPVTCPPHLPGASWHPSAWRGRQTRQRPGAPREDGGAVVVRGMGAHAVKPTIESRLADAEAELAFLRADNGRVARENARLRGQCERLSAEVAMLSEDPEAHARQLRRGLMGARRRDGSDVDLASTADAAARDRPPRASREDRQLSLFLTDGKGALTERKVPGIVSAPPGVLQFGVVQAEVTSTGFVGLRPLGTNDAVNTAPTSTSSVSTKMKSLMKGVLAGGTAVAREPTRRGTNRRRHRHRHRTRPTTRRRDRRTRSCGKTQLAGGKDTAVSGTLRRLALNATPTRSSTSGNRSGRGPRLRWRDPSTRGGTGARGPT